MSFKTHFKINRKPKVLHSQKTKIFILNTLESIITSVQTAFVPYHNECDRNYKIMLS